TSKTQESDDKITYDAVITFLNNNPLKLDQYNAIVQICQAQGKTLKKRLQLERFSHLLKSMDLSPILDMAIDEDDQPDDLDRFKRGEISFQYDFSDHDPHDYENECDDEDDEIADDDEDEDEASDEQVEGKEEGDGKSPPSTASTKRKLDEGGKSSGKPKKLKKLTAKEREKVLLQEIRAFLDHITPISVSKEVQKHGSTPVDYFVIELRHNETKTVFKLVYQYVRDYGDPYGKYMLYVDKVRLLPSAAQALLFMEKVPEFEYLSSTVLKHVITAVFQQQFPHDAIEDWYY
ncbi:MAG: hypothetical protein K2Z81_09920, partial [Cyanobacteria bacterium]|nr:hypothetical protein [Cyanobacteriota bacterium]